MVPCSSPDQQSISPHKQMKTPRKSARAFSSKATENHAPTNIQYGGLLHHQLPPPLFLSSSYPPSASIFNHPASRQHLQHHYHHQQQQQPPLLPLPAPITHPSRIRGLSCPPSTRKPNNKRRDQSLTPKKPKPTKREDPKQDLTTTRQAISECLIIASTKRLGPDPNDLPKDVSRVLGKSLGAVDIEKLEEFSGTVFSLAPPPSSLPLEDVSRVLGKSLGAVDIEKLEEFSGTVFSLAPPPSSLPLPKFSMRPKLCCNAEAAAGIDAGATDNLRRLLRLR